MVLRTTNDAEFNCIKFPNDTTWKLGLFHDVEKSGSYSLYDVANCYVKIYNVKIYLLRNSWRPKWQYISIGSTNSLVPNGLQAVNTNN